MKSAALQAALSELSTLVVPASQLERPAAPTVSCGIPAIDELAGGLPRGAMTEICGPASSGRTSLLFASIATATRNGEVCALVDATDNFDPLSAEHAGVQLDRLLWVRCGVRRAQVEAAHNVQKHVSVAARTGGRGGRHPREVAANTWKGYGGCPVDKGAHTQIASPISSNADEWLQRTVTIPERSAKELISRGEAPGAASGNKTQARYASSDKPEFARLEQALKVTDLLLQSGGFGIVAIDLAGLSIAAARRVPMTSWFRFRRAVENTPTVLLVVEQEPHAKTCASLVLHLEQSRVLRFESQRFRVVQMDQDACHVPAHASLLEGISVQAEVVRGSGKKPSGSVRASFESATPWTA